MTSRLLPWGESALGIGQETGPRGDRGRCPRPDPPCQPAYCRAHLQLSWSVPGSSRGPTAPRRPSSCVAPHAAPRSRSLSVGRPPGPRPSVQPGALWAGEPPRARVGRQVWGQRPEHRLLLGRPTHPNVRAYLLLTRVFAMLSRGPFQPKRYICSSVFPEKNKVCQANAVCVRMRAGGGTGAFRGPVTPSPG